MNRSHNQSLRDAYLWHRLNGMTARAAHAAADSDFRNGKPRYPDSGQSYASPQDGEPLLRHIDPPSSFGLREVGTVIPEPRHREYWQRGNDSVGWLTDPFGDVFKDGTGLCWGVVYQLPSRKGRTRFVSGYVFGGGDIGPTVDFSRIFEGERGGSDRARDDDAAIEAARAADGLAQRAAESEREYQTAWQAGSRFAQLGEEVATERKQLLALLKERRAVRTDPERFPNICAALFGSIRQSLAKMSEVRKERRSLARGEGRGLSFYPGEARLACAFNDGAGTLVIVKS